MKSCFITLLCLLSHAILTVCSAQDFPFQVNPNNQWNRHLLGTRLEIKRISGQLQRLKKVAPSQLAASSTITMENILKTDVPQYLTEWQTGKSIQRGTAQILKKNMFKYALSVTAIGAGTTLLKDFSETGEIRPHKALDFLTDSKFFKSSAGIFVGSTMLSALGNFLPPGISPILKTFPGFLGAALGYEWSQDNLDKLDWFREGISALASSAAFVALGSGGIFAIAGGVAASILSDQIYDTLFKMESPDSNLTTPIDPVSGAQATLAQSGTANLNVLNPTVNRELLLKIEKNASEADLPAIQKSLDHLKQFNSQN